MSRSTGDAPAVSVVVPVRDDRDGLRRLLAALERQTLPRSQFEVIVADDGSADGSTDGLESEGVRVVRGPRRNAYAARNRALALARAPVVAFTDADCLPEPRWLESGLVALADADVAGGGIRVRPPGRPTTWSLLTIELHFNQDEAVEQGRAMTANLFVRRSLLEARGGFDDALRSGGDGHFVYHAVRAGARLVHAPEALVEHPTSDGPRPLLRRTWERNRSTATQISRGDGRTAKEPLWRLVPVLATALSRRRAGRPAFRLDAGRLAACGVAPRPLAEARALVALYAVVGPVARTAQLVGGLEGRRARRARVAGEPSVPSA